MPLLKNPLNREPNTRKFQETAEHSVKVRQGHRGAEGSTMDETPQVMKGNWDQAKGVKWGGCTVMGHGGRRMHAPRSKETSVGSWQVAGEGGVQVDGASLWESRWVVGSRERRYDNKHY